MESCWSAPKRKAKQQYRSADDSYFDCQGNITESNLISILVRNTVCFKSYNGTKGADIFFTMKRVKGAADDMYYCYMIENFFFFCRQIEQLSLVNRDACYSIWDTVYWCALIMRNEWHKYIKVKVNNLLLIAQILSITEQH